MDISNERVYGIEESIIASGYPLQVYIDKDNEATCHGINNEMYSYKQGVSDDVESAPYYKRATKLGGTPAGSGHNNFLKGIIVQADLTCSQNMHMQILRYNFFDIVSSQSKMHRLLKMDITKSVNEYVSEDSIINIMQEIDAYNEDPTPENYLKVIYNCPMGLELTFRFSTNYLQLKTIVLQRYTHKLPEWKYMVEWILTLPYFKELTGVDVDVKH